MADFDKQTNYTILNSHPAYVGYGDAIFYDAYDPTHHGFKDEEDLVLYRKGYCLGMDFNFVCDGGVASEKSRLKTFQDYRNETE